MWRTLVAGFAALALCACETSWVSAVDVAPISARPTTAPLANGLYCPAGVSWRADGEVVAISAGERQGCMTYSWDIPRRIVIAEAVEETSSEDPPGRFEIALAPLGDGLFVAQTANTNSDGLDPASAPYLLQTLLILDGVFAYTGRIDDNAKAQLASRFPQIGFAPIGEADDRLYIKSGHREDIARLLRDTALLGLTRVDRSGNSGLALFTRVNAPGAETVRSILGRSDIVAARAAASRLARLAPPGIELEEPDF